MSAMKVLDPSTGTDGDSKQMDNFFEHKVILITGAAGTVGKELIEQLLPLNPREIRALDNNESELFLVGQKYGRTQQQVTAYLGDVRDYKKMENVCGGVDVLFHCAAFKHVFLAEYNPFDTVQTNLMGVNNVIQAAMHHRVPMVIFTSSDKAVNPTSTMGTSKLMGERLITSANIVSFSGHQIFSSVRFGNVIGSRGSVVPIFLEQIKQGGPVTLTSPEMTRFFMTIKEAALFVIESARIACGGEVFVTKMPVMRIKDLAVAMIELLAPLYGYEPKDLLIETVGIQCGEKLYEELLSGEEINRSLEMSHMFVILPALRGFYHKIKYLYEQEAKANSITRPYISASGEPMSLEQIKTFLIDNDILGEPLLRAHLKPVTGKFAPGMLQEVRRPKLAS